jgi:hypothetical protein
MGDVQYCSTSGYECSIKESNQHHLNISKQRLCMGHAFLPPAEWRSGNRETESGFEIAGAQRSLLFQNKNKNWNAGQPVQRRVHLM